MTKSSASPKRSLRKAESALIVERLQTGVRIEKRLLKVMKATAEYLDISLGDLIEGVFLHAFEGKCAFSEETRRKIDAIRKVYDLELDASASHRMVEAEGTEAGKDRAR